MPEITSRPTPEYIAGLFQKHEIMPIHYAYLVGRRTGACRGCALGALIVETLGSVDAAFDRIRCGDAPEFLRRLTELPESFLKGLDHGFSYASSSTAGQLLWNQFHKDPLYVEGFETGRTVHNLVLPDPPQESSNG
jgi:hypothetical protein